MSLNKLTKTNSLEKIKAKINLNAENAAGKSVKYSDYYNLL